MISIHFYELVLPYFIFHQNFSNSNIDNCFKSYVKCNNISTYNFLTSNSFICHEFNSVAIFNIPHTTFYAAQYIFIISFSFFEYSFFTNSTFYNIFNVNSVTIILNNDFYITYLFDGDNRFLFCNCKVTGECINIFYQIKNKSNTFKIFITSDNNAFFLITIFVIFRVFDRKRRVPKAVMWEFF